jgi:hypothetical protein
MRARPAEGRGNKTIPLACLGYPSGKCLDAHLPILHPCSCTHAVRGGEDAVKALDRAAAP